MPYMRLGVAASLLALTTSCQSLDNAERNKFLGVWDCVVADTGKIQVYSFTDDGAYSARYSTRLESLSMKTEQPVEFTQHGNWEVSERSLKLTATDIDANYSTDRMMNVSAEDQGLINEFIANIALSDSIGVTVTLSMESIIFESVNSMLWGETEQADRMTCERSFEGTA